MEASLIFGVLKEGLKLLNSLESGKYLKKVTKLESDYYEELKKPYGDRSQFELDNVMLELSIIARNFIRYSESKPGGK